MVHKYLSLQWLQHSTPRCRFDYDEIPTTPYIQMNFHIWARLINQTKYISKETSKHNVYPHTCFLRHFSIEIVVFSVLKLILKIRVFQRWNSKGNTCEDNRQAFGFQGVLFSTRFQVGLTCGKSLKEALVCQSTRAV
jgi:hypothetical protein